MADTVSPTERELEILKILWELGPSTVRDVFDRMNQHEDLAQNTVQTFLRIMEDKGLVRHEQRGRAFVYAPLYTRERTLSRFLHRIFDGAVDQLVLNALKVKKLSDRELGELEQIIQDAKKRRSEK
jgi:BlaI family penicillinase repressor